MNYLAEINAFERWLESNRLPISSQLLWYKLMNRNNRAGWKDWIQVDNLRLMADMQMSREATFIEVRNHLVNAGLIEYRKGKKGCPNLYRIIPFTTDLKVQTEVETEVKRVVQTEVQQVVQTGVETADINKHKNKLKQKQKIKSNTNVLPERFSDDDRLNDAILDFVAHREEIKKPVTERGLKIILKRLDEMASDNETKVLILEQSIASRWQGIFPLNENGQKRERQAQNKKSYGKQSMNDFVDVGKEWLNDRTGVSDDFCSD